MEFNPDTDEVINLSEYQTLAFERDGQAYIQVLGQTFARLAPTGASDEVCLALALIRDNAFEYEGQAIATAALKGIADALSTALQLVNSHDLEDIPTELKSRLKHNIATIYTQLKIVRQSALTVET